ncbi:uncharacterized protein LOC122389550 [Amphibalanus amphitrite]|uniref:uncharacterized protein LOC122365492 n=1 Tax=Amphibalanus amphitrite TaxID=1232801 RepID=UPI001C9279FF|nr:uncharacterized protein LOC122365492 [Amphibalanus amphitrite]XP_043195455.1 uncharacterized protein LOC122366877 [Amphibalanus amphitrite]XP_043237639.1 uncharacterized protein LOC122389550 [Amphibalanus amphitrite]
MNALVALSALVAAASAQLALPYAGLYNAGLYHGYNGYAGYNGLYPAGYTGYNGFYPTTYAGGYHPAGYAGYGYAAPYSYASTYHAQDELGQASYGHVQADQAHSAVRDAYGNVVGSYSYLNPEGETITVKYTAGANGFQVASNALPVAPVDTGVAPVETRTAPIDTGVAPLPVDFTPEVKAATAEHLAAVEEAKSRNKRSLVFPTPSVYAGVPAFYSAGYGLAPAPAVTYSAGAGYPAELTEVILNPGHATAYRVDPVA